MPIRDAAHFRARAEQCRAMALAARRADIRAALEELAIEFEQLAREIERGTPTTREPGRPRRGPRPTR